MDIITGKEEEQIKEELIEYFKKYNASGLVVVWKDIMRDDYQITVEASVLYVDNSTYEEWICEEEWVCEEEDEEWECWSSRHSENSVLDVLEVANG